MFYIEHFKEKVERRMAKDRYICFNQGIPGEVNNFNFKSNTRRSKT